VSRFRGAVQTFRTLSQTHLAGDVLEAAPKSLRAELHEHLRALFEAPDLPTARILLQALLDAYASRAPNAMASQAIDISVLVCFNNNHDRSHQ